MISTKQNKKNNREVYNNEDKKADFRFIFRVCIFIPMNRPEYF
jgi:hypothetical protein